MLDSRRLMELEPHLAPAPTLLPRVAVGDPAAVRECLARFGGLVWSIARRFEPTEAEDAVQEIFLDLWRSAGRYDPSVATETAFVAMLARRRLIDRRRSRLRRPATDDIDEVPSIPDAQARPPETGVEARQAAQALRKLRPEQREVLVLSTCHGMSHGEIAAQTGMPLGTVKAHARRGLMSIRAALLGVQPEEQP